MRCRRRGPTEGRGVQLGGQQLLHELHPRLSVRERFFAVVVFESRSRSRPSACRALSSVPDRSIVSGVQSVMSPMPITPATPGNVWPNAGPAEPRDLRELRMRGPEALGPRRAVAGVLERAGDGVAVLEADRTVCVFRSPAPVLPPLPVTTQSYGVVGSVDPPMPVSTQLSCVPSLTE